MRSLGLALLIVFGAIPAHAQNTGRQFWPELDIYANLNSRTRLVFSNLYVLDRTSGSLTGNFTCYFDLALRPLFRRDLRRREDVFRQRFLTFRAGYRYRTMLSDGNSPSENRAILEATARYPLPGQLVIVDRNRGEFRFIRGQPF